MFSSENKAFQNIYKMPSLEKREYHPIDRSGGIEKRSFLKAELLFDSAVSHLKERLSIDAVIKELSFSIVALVTYVFMQNSGRIDSLKGLGSLIGLVLIAALVYNLFKASTKSLTPGVVCLVGGLVLLSTNIHQEYFKFLSNQSIEYIIGVGALFIGMALFKSENY
ncbi:MAG: hypothetical protein K2X39_04970 [Silvanigrellaceae bacterium]|nr:hypothetical protein [Silvanigrellaceae bacterium]